jgi:hypothetical protein
VIPAYYSANSPALHVALAKEIRLQTAAVQISYLWLRNYRYMFREDTRSPE